MCKVPTQAERVIRYIKDYGSITRADALMKIGVANLPAVIDVLRHEYGYNIVTHKVEKTGMYNTKVTYAKYTLEEINEDKNG